MQVSLLIDQGNTVKESYGYAAYGVANAALTRSTSGFNAKTNPYRYTGKRLDSGSGTYDMGARRYSASAGRFLQYDVFYDALSNLGLSEDPLTQNRYALAGGNPVNFVEVDGHWPKFVDRAVKKVGGAARAAGSAAKRAAQSCGRSVVCTQVVSMAVGYAAGSAGAACLPAAGICSVVFAAAARGGTAFLLSKAAGKSTKSSLIQGGLGAAGGGGTRAAQNAIPNVKRVPTRLPDVFKAVVRGVKNERVIAVGKSGHRVISKKTGQFVRGYTPPKPIPLIGRR